MCNRILLGFVSIGILALLILNFITYKIELNNYQLSKNRSNIWRSIPYAKVQDIANNGNPIELVPTNHDFSMFISTNDATVSRIIRSRGTWEQEIVETLYSFVKPGHIVVHLGGHIGFDDILLGKIVGSTGKIYTFEPNPKSYDINRKNLVINNLDSIVILYPFGVTSQNADNTIAKICFDYVNTGGAFINHESSAADECHDVKLVALDSILYDVPKIDILFMDIEGYEIKAIEGAKNLLTRSPNALIIMECSNEFFKRAGSNLSKFLAQYSDSRYRFFNILNSTDTSFEDYKYVEMTPSEILQTEEYVNLIIMPHGFVIDESLLKFFKFHSGLNRGNG